MVYRLHCTKKLLDRVNQKVDLPCFEATTNLGNWYATVLFWRPQIALLVNERTLLPVLMPMAPVATLASRFPQQLRLVLIEHNIDRHFIDLEIEKMKDVHFSKTVNRSVVGVMNQFSIVGEIYRDTTEKTDLIQLSIELARTPCSSLYKSQISPERELKFYVNSQYSL